MNMKIETNMNEIDVLKSMNSHLPYDIRVVGSEIVDENFNSRFSAIRREYVYQVINKTNPFNYKYYWEYPYNYSFDILNECADIVMKKNNFYNFCKHSSDIDNYDCNIYNSLWIKEDDILKARVAELFSESLIKYNNRK